MIIGSRIFDLHIVGCRSLKEKRAVIKSLRDRLRTKFNVSVAEIGHHDLWQRSTIAIVAVNRNTAYINGVFNRILKLIELEKRVVIINIETEFL